MIKGCQKRIIQIKDTKNKLFEEAYFVLKCEVNDSLIHSKDIINEATMVINNYSNEGSSSKSSSKKISRVLWFFIGFVLSFVITLSVYLLFI